MSYGYNNNFLRQQNIFDQFGNYDDYSQVDPNQDNPYPYDDTPPVNDGRSVAPPMIPQDSIDVRTKRIMDAIGKVYTPETKDTSRYSNLLDDFPDRANYKPSLGRALVAGGLTLGSGDKGLEDAMKFVNEPYLNAMSEWSARTQPFQQAASLENQRNVNERNLAGNVVTNMTNQDRIDATERNNAEKNRITEANNKMKNEAAMVRNRAYDFHQRLGKGWAWDLKGPTVKKMNLDTGQIVDTGLPTGKLDDETRLDMENDNKLEQIDRQNKGKLDVARQGAVNVEAGQNEDWIDEAGNVFSRNKVTGKITGTQGGPSQPVGKLHPKPSSSSTSGPNQLEKDRVAQATMQRLFITSKEDAGNMQDDGTGKLKMIPRPEVTPGLPGLGWGAIGQDKVDSWDRTMKKIDPTYVPPVTNVNMGQNSQQQNPKGAVTYKRNPSNTNEQVKYVNGVPVEVSSDGGKTWVKY